MDGKKVIVINGAMMRATAPDALEQIRAELLRAAEDWFNETLRPSLEGMAGGRYSFRLDAESFLREVVRGE